MAMAIMAAVAKATGTPFQAFGVLADSNLTRMQLKTTIINKKPMEVPTPLAKASTKVFPVSVFPCTTPKTAQLVVIKGR